MATITETPGDIFATPPHSILIHACNAKGSWGAGVALAFKKKYPAAYQTYHTHCTQPPQGTPLLSHQKALVGSTLLIPPSPHAPAGGKHWIACLFTSLGYGRAVSPPDAILTATKQAMQDLAIQLDALKEAARDKPPDEKTTEEEGGEEGEEGKVVGKCYAVRINSGLFAVPWVKTKEVLEGGGVDVVVLVPDAEAGEGGEEGEGGRGVVRVGGSRGGRGGMGRGGGRLDGWLRSGGRC